MHTFYYKILSNFVPSCRDIDIPSSDEYLDPHDERCNVKMIGTRLRCQTHIAPIDGSGLAVNPGICK